MGILSLQKKNLWVFLSDHIRKSTKIFLRLYALEISTINNYTLYNVCSCITFTDSAAPTSNFLRICLISQILFWIPPPTNHSLPPQSVIKPCRKHPVGVPLHFTDNAWPTGTLLSYKVMCHYIIINLYGAHPQTNHSLPPQWVIKPCWKHLVGVALLFIDNAAPTG